jgi:hypothetical protein
VDSASPFRSPVIIISLVVRIIFVMAGFRAFLDERYVTAGVLMVAWLCFYMLIRFWVRRRSIV